eukprot:4281679-Alexandrium_andersonii.AAC.1
MHPGNSLGCLPPRMQRARAGKRGPGASRAGKATKAGTTDKPGASEQRAQWGQCKQTKGCEV